MWNEKKTLKLEFAEISFFLLSVEIVWEPRRTHLSLESLISFILGSNSDKLRIFFFLSF